MSRITGTDAANLMEAYNAVYAPQQLTEEQFIEEVDYWVNLVLDEGYDLSHITWDEVYLMAEDAVGRTGRSWGQSFGQGLRSAASGALNAVGDAVKGAGDVAGATLQGNIGQKTTSSNPLARLGNLASRAGTAPVRGAIRFGQGAIEGLAGGGKPQPTFQNSGGFGRYGAPGSQVKTPTPKPSAGPGGTPPTSKAYDSGPNAWGPRKPQPPVAGQRPATPTPSAARPAQPPVAGQRPATPTPSGSAPTSRSGGFGVPTAPLVARSSVSSATEPGSVPSGAPSGATASARPSFQSDIQDLRRMRAASIMRQQGRKMPDGSIPTGDSLKPKSTLSQSFDPFDVVMGHLIDEGYADTEEAALTIMANMSEEWKQSIVEGMFDFLPKSKTVVTANPDKRNPLQKAVDATKPLYSALPKSKTVVPAKQARSREFTNPPS